MTYPSSWYGFARECRMRAAEILARADEMKAAKPKVLMFEIAADYEKLAEWAEKNSEARLIAANIAKLPELLRK